MGDRAELDLGEKVWPRAVRLAEQKAQTFFPFLAGVAIMSASVAIAQALWLTPKSSDLRNVIVSVVGASAGAVIFFVVTLVYALIKTPLNQRDELRDVLAVEEVLPTVNFDISPGIRHAEGPGYSYVFIKVTNHGPTADFQAQVEFINGVAKQEWETPFPIGWRSSQGPTLRIPSGHTQWLLLARMIWHRKGAGPSLSTSSGQFYGEIEFIEPDETVNLVYLATSHLKLFSERVIVALVVSSIDPPGLGKWPVFLTYQYTPDDAVPHIEIGRRRA